MDRCDLCGRKCYKKKRYCIESTDIVLAAALIHYGEEPPLVNAGGSGAVFFSGCSLKCTQCQNEQISHQGLGRIVKQNELVEIFLALQKAGAQNLNLITGTHFVTQIIEALQQAKKNDLRIPVFWNTGTYESIQTLEMLLPYIDGFLADLKTLDADFAVRLCKAPEYPQAAIRNLLRMAESKVLHFENESLTRGLIVRHLVYPGHLESTRKFLEWFSQNLKGKALLSFMAQYTPVHQDALNPELNRRLTAEEWAQCLEWLDEYEIEEGFFQELSDEGEWFPDFTKEKPFPAGDCRPIWHYSKGFLHGTF